MGVNNMFDKTLPFLPFSLPTIGDDEIREVVAALKSNWITTGPRTKRFEEEFAALKGCTHAIALNSCTAALHLALNALDLSPGDEVLTTVNTFAATANVMLQVGAKPVFCDIETDTMNMDLTDAETRITSRTRAIVPVHLAGHPVDLDAACRLAKKHGLRMIQDAAHAADATYQGGGLDAYGDMTCYSFYATKVITTAEGGLLTTSTDSLAESVRMFSLHGMSRDAWKRYQKGGSWQYDILAPGFKYNMADINAALGLIQLKRMPEFLAIRRSQAAAYQELLSDLADFVALPVERPYAGHSYHLYIIQLELDNLTCSRDEFIEFLTEKGIGTSVHFIPFFHFTFYREKFGLREQDFPTASSVFKRVVSLPLYPLLKQSDMERVSEAVHEAVRRFTRVR